MDPNPDPAPSVPRKVKFAPKGPPRRKSTTAKIETAADDYDGSSIGDAGFPTEDLSRKLKDHFTRRGPKVEKSPVQVAFSHGASSSAIRTFGKQKGQTKSQSKKADGEELATDDTKSFGTFSSSSGTKVVEESKYSTDEDTTDSSDGDGTCVKKKREYREPWDYDSNYPITTPLRRPYSGDPEVLDKEEFENAVEYDENTLNSAPALGLPDLDDAPKMFFFQFPPKIPLKPSSKGKEMASSSSSGRSSRKKCSLADLPEGYMGKLLIYKSGAIKMKLGDILYDVSPGTDRTFPQSVVAINTKSKECVDLGELNKNAVVSPDVDSMMDNMVNLD